MLITSVEFVIVTAPGTHPPASPLCAHTLPPPHSANAEAGMLVQRAFREGAAVENTEKASTMGVLMGKVSFVR